MLTGARRRLKKLFRKYTGDETKFFYIATTYASWYGMSKGYKNYYITQNYDKLYKELYIKEFVNKKC